MKTEDLKIRGGLLEAIEKFRIETREWLEANCLDSILLEQREGSKPLNFRKTL